MCLETAASDGASPVCVQILDVQAFFGKVGNRVGSIAGFHVDLRDHSNHSWIGSSHGMTYGILGAGMRSSNWLDCAGRLL